MTLIETLIVIIALVAISGAIFDALNQSARINARDTEWNLSLQAGRTGLARMANEVRQSYAINDSGPNFIDLNVTEGSSTERVYYECDVAQSGTGYHECIRLQTTVGGTLPALSTGAVAISNVLNGSSTDPVFTYSPSQIQPTFIGLRVELPSSGNLNNVNYAGLAHTVVFTDGAFLRNQSVT